MALLEVKNLTFKYALENVKAINNISFKVNEGDFLLVCGKTGCGKTTLLKLMKKELMPNGEKTGEVLFLGKNIEDNDQPQSIGYVFQNPDNQIVTDKVWHELSFGLENLNTPVDIMSNRIAEIANFFGIDNWFYDKTANLSGGQKQILNLAAILVMNPQVILLDEPTSQLDPVARSNFLGLLTKINKELGITIILVEHNLEDVFGIVDEVLLLDSGKLLIKDTKEEVNNFIRNNNLDIQEALPSALQITNSLNLKVSYFVKDARSELVNNFLNTAPILPYKTPNLSDSVVIDGKGIFLSYDKEKQDILNDLNIKVMEGEILTILGSNGSGKTTLLNVLSGVIKPYSGRVLIRGKKIKDYKSNSLYINNLTVLPQNPLNVFLKKRVIDDLNESLSIAGSSEEDKNRIIELFELQSYLYSHPYDLSGGEIQKCALAKILLLKPKILFLDEPTKGLDAFAKKQLINILKKLKDDGVTIVIVTHDIEFSATLSDRIAMLFDGKINEPTNIHEFFSNNILYTTKAALISKNFYQNTVTNKEVITLALANGLKKWKNMLNI